MFSRWWCSECRWAPYEVNMVTGKVRRLRCVRHTVEAMRMWTDGT